MKRSEGFFGLHFDFHAGADCNEIGKTFTEEMAREIIETLKPDFIQCDCKGHPGYSSYPTIAGNPAPGFVGDPLKIWRKVTSEYGVPLTMHYSGVFDRRAIELHPEWAATGEDKTPNKEMTSVFKGYADGLLIPQLIELANGYGVDAVWVDGECWASVPDFDEANVRAFEGEYKMKLKKDADGKYEKDSTEYKSFLDYSRGLFKDYLTRYVDAVHAEAPQFEIASNWAYSSFMPVPVESGVNFLSGDFNSVDSYNAARLDARVLCEQGMPWDLVAWGFFYTFQKNSTIATKGVPA
ncbi:MAG: hypothetical protein FWF03_05750, partial [Defluviitaleaceae bacterium]|nr:hypothetical protein [Defluviitaleaceae bacterium]